MIDIEKVLLEVHVTLEKLKFERKGLMINLAILIITAITVILFGLYAQYVKWSEYPIVQTSIFVSGILLAIAFRPLQQHKKKLASAEEKRSELETILLKDNLSYKAEVHVTKNEKGAFTIEKSIKLFTIK